MLPDVDAMVFEETKISFLLSNSLTLLPCFMLSPTLDLSHQMQIFTNWNPLKFSKDEERIMIPNVWINVKLKAARRHNSLEWQASNVGLSWSNKIETDGCKLKSMVAAVSSNVSVLLLAHNKISYQANVKRISGTILCWTSDLRVLRFSNQSLFTCRIFVYLRHSHGNICGLISSTLFRYILITLIQIFCSFWFVSLLSLYIILNLIYAMPFFILQS